MINSQFAILLSVFSYSLVVSAILHPHEQITNSLSKSFKRSLQHSNHQGRGNVQNKIVALLSQVINLQTQIIKLQNDAGQTCTKKVEKDCAAYYMKGERRSGVYKIEPDDQGSFKVFCDMKTSGGGWTVFQRRMDGSVNFYRGWNDYKKGFGNLESEFWLGLDKIHRLTRAKRNKLRIDMEDTKRNKRHAEYGKFSVANEKQKYKLTVGKYSGTAGDSFSDHNGFKFSTKDADNDTYSKSCAKQFKGAWWYRSCHSSNLNGMYHHGAHKSYADGVNWYAWKGHHYSLKTTSMKIKSFS